jgi:hypothetical protein
MGWPGLIAASPQREVSGGSLRSTPATRTLESPRDEVPVAHRDSFGTRQLEVHGDEVAGHKIRS